MESLYILFFEGWYVRLHIYQKGVNSKVKIAIFIYVNYMLNWLTDKEINIMGIF